MSALDNGGPAFPVVTSSAPDFDGMTLRDYFAGKALSGLLADPEPFDRHPDDSSIAETYAREAYLYADAMLEARK